MQHPNAHALRGTPTHARDCETNEHHTGSEYQTPRQIVKQDKQGATPIGAFLEVAVTPACVHGWQVRHGASCACHLGTVGQTTVALNSARGLPVHALCVPPVRMLLWHPVDHASCVTSSKFTVRVRTDDVTCHAQQLVTVAAECGLGSVCTTRHICVATFCHTIAGDGLLMDHHGATCLLPLSCPEALW